MNTILNSTNELKPKIEKFATAHDKLQPTGKGPIIEVIVALKKRQVEMKALQADSAALKCNLQLHQKLLRDLKDRSRCHLCPIGGGEHSYKRIMK